MMKLPRYLSWIKNPFELLEVYFQRKFTRETYITTVAMIVGFSGFVHGFIITQSELLLFNDPFLHLFNDILKVPGQNYSDVSDFMTHFLSVLYLGEMIGALLSYPFSDAFGRKPVMLVSAMSGVVMLLWYGSSTVTPNLYTAKFFLGISLGSLVCTATVFIAETSPSFLRGQHMTWVSFTTCFGSVTSFLLYYPFSNYTLWWRVILLVPMAVLMLQSWFLCFLHDSPRWLLANKTPSDCSLSLQYYRRSHDVRREFNDMYRALSGDARLGDSWLELLFSKSIKLRLLLASLLQIMQQVCGVQIVTIFVADLLNVVGLQVRSPFFAFALFTILLSACLGTYCNMHYQLPDIFGRRKLLLYGSTCMSLSWILLTCLFIWRQKQENNNSDFTTFALFLQQLLCIVILTCFAFVHYKTWGSITWCYAAEIFPYRARAKAAAITTFLHYFAAVLGANLLRTWLLSGNKGRIVMFVVLFGVSLVLGLFVYVAIPETKDLILEDMEELFHIDNTSYCCGCLPHVGSGVLGLRQSVNSHHYYHHNHHNHNSHHSSMLVPSSSDCHSHATGSQLTQLLSKDHPSNRNNNGQRQQHSSLLIPSSSKAGGKYQSLGSPAGMIATVHNSFMTPSPHHSRHTHSRHHTHSHSNGDEEEGILEPSALHKYSMEMKESKFHLIQENGPNDDYEDEEEGEGGEEGVHDFNSDQPLVSSYNT